LSQGTSFATRKGAKTFLERLAVGLHHCLAVLGGEVGDELLLGLGDLGVGFLAASLNTASKTFLSASRACSRLPPTIAISIS